MDKTIGSHENMLAHLYEQQHLIELQLHGIKKQREEITAFIEVLKRSKNEDFILSMLDEDDIKGE